MDMETQYFCFNFRPGMAQTRRGEDLGLPHDLIAFYDALASNDRAVQAMGDDKHKFIAAELISTAQLHDGWAESSNPLSRPPKVPLRMRHMAAAKRDIESVRPPPAARAQAGSLPGRGLPGSDRE